MTRVMSLVGLPRPILPTAGIHAQDTAAPVTFTRDIAPILYRQCASCHRQDGAAPFSLLTYEDARRHGAQIATATASRYMPPWKPDPGFGDLAGERRLSDDAIATIDS